MSIQFGDSVPGLRTSRTYTPRHVLASRDGVRYLPAGKIIDGSKARDPLNTGDLSTLRPGMLIGKITSGGKYAPSIIGKTTAAYVDNDTTITVGAATAVELVRRIGATGTFKLVGPPTAAGTVAATSVTYTAVDTSTGAITCSDLNLAKVTDSLIMPADGSETPIGILDEHLRVTDIDGNNLDVQLSRLIIGGLIDVNQIINWPADASTKTYLFSLLNSFYAGSGPSGPCFRSDLF